MKTSFIPAASIKNFILRIPLMVVILFCYVPVFSQPVLTFTPFVQGLKAPVTELTGACEIRASSLFI